MTDHGVGITEESTRHKLEVDGTTIHYHDVGSGEPLLLLPFWGPQPGLTAWLSLHKVLPTLSEHFRCVAMDLVNYGRTGPITYHEPIHDVIARCALNVLDHLGIDQFHAVGTSVGATTCIDIALNHPERVRKLVVGSCHASTGGDPYLLVPFRSEAGRAMRVFNAEPDDVNLYRALRSCVHDETLVTDDLVAQIKKVRAESGDHIKAQEESVSVSHSNLGDLDKITLPTLIIHGRFDRMVPVEQGLVLLNYIESSDIVVFNNCGHWPPYEQPEEWTSQVLRFLNSN